MEQLKHECGVAMIRLLKPLEYYEEKYGTWMYGLNKLYLLMEKQHNRGQEGAGLACRRLAGIAAAGGAVQQGMPGLMRWRKCTACMEKRIRLGRVLFVHLFADNICALVSYLCDPAVHHISVKDRERFMQFVPSSGIATCMRAMCASVVKRMVSVSLLAAAALALPHMAQAQNVLMLETSEAAGDALEALNNLQAEFINAGATVVRQDILSTAGAVTPAIFTASPGATCCWPRK